MPEELLQLVSPRLLLRPLKEDDVDLVVELVTDPEMMEYAGGPATSERIRTGKALPVVMTKLQVTHWGRSIVDKLLT